MRKDVDKSEQFEIFLCKDVDKYEQKFEDYGYGGDVPTLSEADSASDYGYGSEVLTMNEADSVSARCLL